MKLLIAAVTVGILIATPAFAAPRHKSAGDPRAAYAAVTPAVSPTPAQSRQKTGATTREAALHDCSVKSGQYREMTWGTMQGLVFRACMTQYGQQE
jgi:hypothetical protein